MNNATIESPAPRVSSLCDTALWEWVASDRHGLEHGFTLIGPPSGTTANGSTLEFDLAVRGNLRPKISPDGASLHFFDDQDGTKLTYAALKVCDAQARKLPTRFVAGPTRGVRLIVEIAGACYPITIDPRAQQAWLQTSWNGTEESLGEAVAISGDTVSVGAPGEAGHPISGNREQAADSVTGSVHVFVCNRGVWSQQARHEVSDPEAGDVFGFALTLSRNTLVVASYGSAGHAPA